MLLSFGGNLVKSYLLDMTNIHRDHEEIRLLENSWNRLADHCKNPLLRNEWFSACAKAFYSSNQLYVVTNNTQTKIDAIAPLVLTQEHGVKGLRILGASFLGEPSGLLFNDEESLRFLLERLLAIKRPLALNRLQLSSSEISVIKDVSKKKGAIAFLRNDGGSPYVPIATTWEQFESTMTSRQRYDLRRARNRAEKSGPIQFEILSPNSKNLDHYFTEMLHVEAAGWKGRQGTALLFDKRLRTFFYLYSKATSQRGKLRLCFLRINNEAVATLLAVEYFNCFWVLKIGYDETFSRCSPGILLIHDTIRYAFANKLERYEFLGNDAPWIHMWTRLNHSYVTVRIYPLSISGQLGLGLDSASAIIKKAMKLRNKSKS